MKLQYSTFMLSLSVHDKNGQSGTTHLLQLSTKILSHEEECLFLMYFWMLNSSMFPEFLYHPHLSLSDSESSDEDEGQANNNMDCDPTFAGACSSSEPHLLTQGDLNDDVRDLNLSKKQAELLGSRLKGWNLLCQDTKMCFYHGHHEEFRDIFSQEDGVIFCNDVCSVMEVLGHEYNPDQWHLYIDSSKVGL